MLKKLEKRTFKKNPQISTEVDFIIKNGLIYHVKKIIHRLCIPKSCEKVIFETAHDHNNHAGYHRTYQRLIDTIFMPKLARKTRLYVKHCPECELNQTKKHASYEELMPITASTIPFRTIAMDFIVGLPKKFDSILTVTCKTSKKIMAIPGMIT